jgi:hypothetical protein
VGSTGLKLNGGQRRGLTQRLLFALGRFSRQVERVTVSLSDVTNPLGGIDRRCQMRAWLRQGGSVAVQTVDGAGAVDRAATRLATRVEWAIVDVWHETPPRRPLETPPSQGSSAWPGAPGRGHRGAARARPRRA